MKRRVTDASSSPLKTTADVIDQDKPSESTVVFRPELLPAMTRALLKGTQEQAVAATKQFREILSIELRPPIQEVIECGVVPRLVSFLKFKGNQSLQLEAAWALTNIASGTSSQTRVVVEAQAVPVFIDLILSPNTEVSEQSVWALGNICGDSPSYRDMVLEKGILTPLLKAIETTKSFRMLRNATWTLSNLCRGNPPSDYEHLRPMLPTLARLLNCKDQEVVQDAAWAFSYLSEARRSSHGSKKSVLSDICALNITKRLVELLENASQDVQIPALRTVGNIATGTDSQTDSVVQSGCLRPLAALLKSGKRGIQKEAAWTLSNITAGNISQIQAVMESGALSPLINSVFSAEFAIRKESAWAVANAVGGATSKQITQLANVPRLIDCLCYMIEGTDAKILLVCLDALQKIVSNGQSMVEKGQAAKNSFKSKMEKAGIVAALGKLIELDNTSVFDKASELLGYFDDSYGADEDQNLRPNACSDSFAFKDVEWNDSSDSLAW